MADSRFFYNSGSITPERIIALTGAELLDKNVDKNLKFNDVAPLDKAQPDEISFLDNIKYADSLKLSKAGACFIHPKNIKHAPENMLLLITEQPYQAYALTAQAFYPAISAKNLISSSTSIASSAQIGKNCQIDAFAVIGENVEIGDNCYIGSGVSIAEGVIIGNATRIGANSTISHSIIGNNIIIHRGVHIGQDGFGFAIGKNGHIKVPQLGRVIIEDFVEIGSGSCIDRGAGPDTIIGTGSKIDNLVQIGHNVIIGKHSIIISQVGIAGSSQIGNGVVLAGQVGVAGHLKIGSGAKLAAQSGVMSDVPEGAAYGGTPAIPIKEWHRQTLLKRKESKK